MIAASVWIAPLIVYPFGASIERSSALTIPDVTVFSSPKGLPIATTASPTCSADESARVTGVNADDGASTSITARSVEGSTPTTVASDVLPFAKRTWIEEAFSTTCAFVTTWPLVSYTKPEPCAWDAPPPGPPCAAPEPSVTVISTTESFALS